MMKYEIAAASDIGKMRKANEDSFAIWCDMPDQVGVMVADGMGGHVGGQMASSMAVAFARQYLTENKVTELPSDSILPELTKCLIHANQKVFLKSLEETELVGMGTTMVLCLISNGVLYAANVGDSRLYVLSEGNLEQITKDHSMVQELLDAGSITYEEMLHHPQKNIITRAIGTERDIAVDTFSREVKEGDTILLCSDGLTNMVSDSELSEMLAACENAQQTVEKLITRANDLGGSDNITASVIRLINKKSGCGK